MPKRPTPLSDPFSAHEALDRSHLAADFFDTNVAEHPYVRAHPALRDPARSLADQLADFYQLLGRLTLTNDAPPPANNTRPSPNSPAPRAARLRFSPGRIVVVLDDRRELSVPLTWYPTLHRARPAQRAGWQMLGDGRGFHWPDLDLDLSTYGLINGLREDIPRPPTLSEIPSVKPAKRRPA